MRRPPEGRASAGPCMARPGGVLQPAPPSTGLASRPRPKRRGGRYRFRGDGSHGDNGNIAAASYYLHTAERKTAVESGHESPVIFAQTVINRSGKVGGLA